MLDFLRTTSLLITFICISVETAQAECAWVLWSTQYGQGDARELEE